MSKLERLLRQSQREPPRSKICYSCGRSDVEFHRNQNRCKRCNYLRVKRWRKENPEKYRQQNR